MRIISLIPGATEIISSLGLSHNLVGVSHECDFPKEVINLPKLTKSNSKDLSRSFDINEDIKRLLRLGLSIYEVDVNLLKKLKPDVIITQSQCSVCGVVLDDVKKSLKSWLSKETILLDLKSFTFPEIMNEILQIGEKLNMKVNAKRVVDQINEEIDGIKQKLVNVKKKNILCVEWLDPLMTAGNWIPDLLEYSKAQDPYGSKTKSHFINENTINLKKVESIIFMPCGFNIERTEIELKSYSSNLINIFEKKKKYIVNGNRYFNRPGPNLLESVKILCEIIHPTIFKPRPSRERWVQFQSF